MRLQIETLSFRDYLLLARQNVIGPLLLLSLFAKPGHHNMLVIIVLVCQLRFETCLDSGDVRAGAGLLSEHLPRI